MLSLKRPGFISIFTGETRRRDAARIPTRPGMRRVFLNKEIAGVGYRVGEGLCVASPTATAAASGHPYAVRRRRPLPVAPSSSLSAAAPGRPIVVAVGGRFRLPRRRFPVAQPPSPSAAASGCRVAASRSLSPVSRFPVAQPRLPVTPSSSPSPGPLLTAVSRPHPAVSPPSIRPEKKFGGFLATLDGCTQRIASTRAFAAVRSGKEADLRNSSSNNVA